MALLDDVLVDIDDQIDTSTAQISDVSNQISELQELKEDIEGRIFAISIYKMDQFLDDKLQVFVDTIVPPNIDPEIEFQLSKGGSYGVANVNDWTIQKSIGDGPWFNVYAFNSIQSDTSLTEVARDLLIAYNSEFLFGYDFITQDPTGSFDGSYGIDFNVSNLSNALTLLGGDKSHLQAAKQNITKILERGPATC